MSEVGGFKKEKPAYFFKTDDFAELKWKNRLIRSQNDSAELLRRFFRLRLNGRLLTEADCNWNSLSPTKTPG